MLLSVGTLPSRYLSFIIIIHFHRYCPPRKRLAPWDHQTSERERGRKSTNGEEIPYVCVCWRVCVGGLSLEMSPWNQPTVSPRPRPNLPRSNHTLGFLLDDMTTALRRWQLTTSLLEHGIRFRTAMKTKTARFGASVPVLTRTQLSEVCLCAGVCECLPKGPSALLGVSSLSEWAGAVLLGRRRERGGMPQTAGFLDFECFG